MSVTNTIDIKDSILNSVKKLIGITEEYTVFDNDMIMHINTVLTNLIQMGVGNQQGFEVTGATETWADFLGSDAIKLQQIKTYVYIKVKLAFDPPANSIILDSLKSTASELEWRMYVEKGGY